MSGGTELGRVVDEEGDDRPPERQARAANWDWDNIFGYKTFKVVRIKDHRLGGLYWGIVTTVIMYIIVVAFHFEGKHSVKDNGIGTVLTKLKSKGFSDGKVYDEADLRFPVIEPSGAFIMTRRIVMEGQTLGNCVDQDSPEKCPCAEGVTCTDGFCEVQGWCPSLGDNNAATPPAGAVTQEITGLESGVLQIMSSVAFPNLGDHFFVTGESEGGSNPYKNITLGALLLQAEPPVALKDVVHSGALIGMSFLWNCDVTTNCEPRVVIKRLDNGQGFVQKRVRHRRQNGQETRDAIYMFGVRLLVDSSGIGKRISLMYIIIQIGSGLALLKIASMAADFLMLSCFYSEERRQAYYRCKVLETRDYSDVQDRLTLIHDQRRLDSDARQTVLGGGASRASNLRGRGAGGSVLP